MRYLLIFVLLISYLKGGAQVYPTEKYGMTDGLAHTQVLNIYQDNRGYLWFGTFGGGASRYDGESFVTFDVSQGLTNNIVRGLTQDSTGVMWFGTMGGGLFYLENEKFIPFVDTSVLKTVYSLHTDFEGRIWIGADKGIFYIENGELVNFGTENDLVQYSVTHVNGDRKGGVWFSYNDTYGIYKYTDETLIKYDTTRGLSNQMTLFYYHSKDDTTWIGTSEGLYKVSTSDEKDTIQKVDIPLINGDFVFECAEDKLGNLLIGTQNRGLIRWDRKSQFQKLDTYTGLKSNTAFRVLADREDNVWVVSFGEGVVKFHDARFIQYSKMSGLQDRIVSDFSFQKDYSYLATNDGLYKSVGEKWERFHYDIIRGNVNSIAVDDDGVLWFAGDKRSGFVKDGVCTLLGEDEPSFSFNRSVVFYNDKVYFGAWGKGVWEYTREGKLRLYPTTTDLNVFSIYDLFVSKKGSLWVGTWGAGALEIIDDSATVYLPNDGLSSDKVRCFTEDMSGNIYAGTAEGGINKISNGKVVGLINTDQGLIHNTIVSMISRNDTLWCGTVKGVSRISLINNEIKNYDYKSGLKGECMNGAIKFDRKGQLNIGTDQYYYVYNSVEDVEVKVFPGVVLNVVSVNYGEEDIAKYSLGIDKVSNLFKGVKLPHYLNKLTFEYSGIGINRREELQYKYRLVGLEEEFSPARSSKEVTYPDLSSGNYTFEVKACIDDTCSDVYSYSFVILTPFWKTWWFFILVIVGAIFLLFQFFRFRMKKLRMAKIRLERKVSERTFELQKQKEIVEEQHKEIKDSMEYAKRIQAAILPSDRLVKEYFDDSFILYKPKDIVAGDFYWMEVVDGEILFAAADCTGHGVPGAMVSVVCHNALNRSVREYGKIAPASILDKATDLVIEQFEKSDEDVKDGMDIALCSLKGNVLQFSGANNPLWVVRNGEIIETKGTKQPVGKFDNRKAFVNHKMNLETGDAIYIFSDGFVDQFGGNKGKKFKSKAFKQLLLSVQNKSMQEQKSEIDKVFENWRGDLEQIDDVCIIGVRI